MWPSYAAHLLSSPLTTFACQLRGDHICVNGHLLPTLSRFCRPVPLASLNLPASRVGVPSAPWRYSHSSTTGGRQAQISGSGNPSLDYRDQPPAIRPNAACLSSTSPRLVGIAPRGPTQKGWESEVEVHGGLQRAESVRKLRRPFNPATRHATAVLYDEPYDSSFPCHNRIVSHGGPERLRSELQHHIRSCGDHWGRC